ncbi:polyprenyl synthetase family protein [Desulfovibrio sp. OttesenSCG-928-A18]|nr:polyprenyl synthetase family protein [Desulfovibrio sp. OttesenSCG-928-A18]
MLPSDAEILAALKREAARVEEWLSSALHRDGVPPGLLVAMEYSLLAGGKRIRPVLCLVSARMCGLRGLAALPFAGALECIHSYSLIHDDLPAMDNDDLRRGKPSNHKRFDEATAILAGDGLLTDAFTLMGRSCELGLEAGRVLRAMLLVASAAGAAGMVGGQFLDMQYTGSSDVGLEELAAMQAMKTGALLKAACLSGGLLAGADEAALAALERYGSAIGAAFQITDDILDETGSEEELGKPVGRDAERNKNTYPSLLGLEASRRLAREKRDAAILALAPYNCSAASLLKGLAAYIVNRVS